jgi:cation:H+ antiporter
MAVLELAGLVVSIIVLSKSSDVVVSNAARLASFFGISRVAVGFLLVAVATSLPELSVALFSSTGGHGAIAVGNVFGSNIADILLVLGLGGVLYGLRVKRTEVRDVGVVLVLTTAISAYILINSMLGRQALGALEGIILLLVFALYALRVSKNKSFDGARETVTKGEALRSFLWFCAGIVVVLVSAGFAVDYAVQLVEALHVAESFVGATIIAIGTSLPELAIDLKAIQRKHYGIAVGDAIGSTMTNITLVLGTAALVSPISVNLPVFSAAIVFAILANVLFFYSAAVDQKLGKEGGFLMLAIYVAYILTIFTLQVSNIP